MRKSTIARLMLFCYGLNFAMGILSLLIHNWFGIVWSGLFITYCSWWLEKTYFDAGDKNETED
jgi:hypothetical protein